MNSLSLGVNALKPLIGSEVEQVWVWWSLRLVFDSAGTHVDVTNFRFVDACSPDPNYEAWTVAVGGAPSIFCPPGSSWEPLQ